MIIQAAPKSVANKAATWRGANNVKQVRNTGTLRKIGTGGKWPGPRIGSMKKIPGGKLPPGVKFPPMTKPRPGVGGPMIPRPGIGGTNLGKATKGTPGSLINLSAAQKAKVKSAAQAKIAGR